MNRLPHARLSLRTLASQPAFSVTAAGALAIGLAANIVVFAVMNSYLLRPLPYREAHRLVEVRLPEVPGADSPVSQLRKAKSLEAAAFSARGFRVRQGDGSDERVFGFRITPNLFHVLGVTPLIGRAAAGAPSVWLSYEFWRRLPGQEDIVGQTLVVDGAAHAIAGVTPPDFGLQVRDGAIFLPDATLATGRIIARLAEHAPLAAAQDEVRSIVPSEWAAGAVLIPAEEAFRPNGAAAVWLAQAAVAFVLLIACVNICGLLMARIERRRREIAIRAAIGASRGQIFGQLLLENMVLCLSGGGMGLLLSSWGLKAVESWLPANLSRGLRGGVDALHIDWRVALFALLASLAALAVFGLAPAWAALRMDIQSSLSGQGTRTGRRGWGQALAAAEIALALVLLIGAGAMLKSLAGLMSQNLGFSPEGVVTVALETPRMEEAMAAVRAMPGVAVVGRVGPQLYPFGGPAVRGAEFESGDGPGGRAEAYRADPDYFRSVRIPVIAGRTFTARDVADDAAILSLSVAERHFGSAQGALGKRIRLNARNPGSSWSTVIGVVGDVRNPTGVAPQPTAYLPIGSNEGVMMVRTGLADPLPLMRSVRERLAVFDPIVRVWNLKTEVDAYLSPQRFLASVFGAFGLTGLILAAAGMHGMIRYWLSGRTQEMGIRAALGATPADLRQFVLGLSLRTASAGLVLGLFGGWAAQTAVAALWPGVRPMDPVVIACAGLLVTGAAAAAAMAPALWAARVDPAKALGGWLR